MTQQQLDSSVWTSLAMGPKLRAWLGISEGDYRGAEAPERTEAEGRAFTDFLDAWALTELPDDEAGLVDLLDELVSMDLPEAVLRLAERGKTLWSGKDFRGQLSVGIAAMLKGDLELSEAHFAQAQALIPEEPAPYVNLVQIFLHQDRVDEALTWCLAGLDADLNNLRLWDLLAMTLREQHGDYFPEQLMTHAQRRNAWAGLSLAADLSGTADKFLKLRLLQATFDEGERDPRFLVEFTAALGIAGELDKIPPVVWQAEKATSKPLPWQLHVHAAQAHLGLSKWPEALAQIGKARRDPSLDDTARGVLDELETMAQEPQGQSENFTH